MEDVQKCLTLEGGIRETQAPVAYLAYTLDPEDENDRAPNIVEAYSADDVYLGKVGWRPFNKALAKTGFLFVCG